MSRTSYHLRKGQLFYAKTGRAIPESMAGRMTIRGKTVYRDGRRVGQLRQKGISDKISKRIDKNLKVGGARIARDTPRSGEEMKDYEIAKDERDRVSVENFKSAVQYLIDIKALTPNDADEIIRLYINGDDATRSYYWNYVRSLFDEMGFEY